MRKIKIILGDAVFNAELADTAAADKIWDALPMECAFNTWGDEIYFSIPVETGLDSTAREVVQMGDLGYGAIAKLPDIYPIISANPTQLNLYSLFRCLDAAQTIAVGGKAIFEVTLGITAYQVEIDPKLGPVKRHFQLPRQFWPLALVHPSR